MGVYLPAFCLHILHAVWESTVTADNVLIESLHLLVVALWELGSKLYNQTIHRESFYAHNPEDVGRNWMQRHLADKTTKIFVTYTKAPFRMFADAN